MIEEGYTADLSALQHLPEHDDHQDAFDPTCATTGVNPSPGPGDNPFGVHHLMDEDPDHLHDGAEEDARHDHGPENLAAHDPLPEPEPYGVGH